MSAPSSRPTPPRRPGVRPSRRRWVPRSPFHAVTSGLLAVALLVGGTWVIGALAPERPAARPAVAAPATPSEQAEPVWRDPPAEPVPVAAVAAGGRWAAALLYRPDQTRAAWLARLAPLTTDEYLGILDSDGNPDAAPRNVTGAASAVSGAPESAVVDVPTDAGVLRLQLVFDDAGWLVSGADVVSAASDAR